MSTYQITDTIIVKFRPGVGTTRIREILEAVGVVIKKHYPCLEQRLYLVETGHPQGD